MQIMKKKETTLHVICFTDGDLSEMAGNLGNDPNGCPKTGNWLIWFCIPNPRVIGRHSTSQ